MRTGKIGLKAHLYKIGAVPDPQCTCGSPQTVSHVLLDCFHVKELGLKSFGQRQEHDLRVLLASPTLAVKAAKFMIQTGFLNQYKKVQIADA